MINDEIKREREAERRQFSAGIDIFSGGFGVVTAIVVGLIWLIIKIWPWLAVPIFCVPLLYVPWVYWQKWRRKHRPIASNRPEEDEDGDAPDAPEDSDRT